MRLNLKGKQKKMKHVNFVSSGDSGLHLKVVVLDLDAFVAGVDKIWLLKC